MEISFRHFEPFVIYFSTISESIGEFPYERIFFSLLKMTTYFFSDNFAKKKEKKSIDKLLIKILRARREKLKAIIFKISRRKIRNIIIRFN